MDGGEASKKRASAIAYQVPPKVYSQLSGQGEEGGFCQNPILQVFADSDSTNYPEGGTFYLISILYLLSYSRYAAI